MKSKKKIPKPPKPPLNRVMRDGVGHWCKICGSTMPKSGFLYLWGERLCDNDECSNSKSTKRYK